uniref:Post-SET domain-containing protein n=1 Tax=Thelazia callipaeda TaxID=103827 RepID=A0A0N5D5K4_THECL
LHEFFLFCTNHHSKISVQQALKLPDSRKRSFRAEFDENFIAEKKSCITVGTSMFYLMFLLLKIYNFNGFSRTYQICHFFDAFLRKIILITINIALKNEKVVCKNIRRSRKRCGCSCKSPCLPETCECALNGIECLVDRPAFPCRCGASECNNPFGRREYDETRIRAHFRSTLMRLKAAQCQKVKFIEHGTFILRIEVVI